MYISLQDNSNKTMFLFVLQQQHLIELIRERNIEGALDFAQSHLAERGEENPEILSELERTLALLAFEEPEASPFGDLLHPSQRQKVSETVPRPMFTFRPYVPIGVCSPDCTGYTQGILMEIIFNCQIPHLLMTSTV